MVLKTSGIDRYGKMPLLVYRWLTQIHLVTPGGLSTVDKARRGRSISIWWGGGAPWGALGRIGVVLENTIRRPSLVSRGSPRQNRPKTSKKHRNSPIFIFLTPYDVPGHPGALFKGGIPGPRA